MPEEKMHFKDYRSGMLTNGIERAAHRALLYSTGLDREDLGKPMIAVVNSFTEMVPGHFHLRELADFVKQGIIEAGGIPREFSTIAICDGICQGHKGMSYPPVSYTHLSAPGGRHVVPEDQVVIASFILYELHRISALILVLHLVNLPSAGRAGVNITTSSWVFSPVHHRPAPVARCV